MCGLASWPCVHVRGARGSDARRRVASRGHALDSTYGARGMQSPHNARTSTAETATRPYTGPRSARHVGDAGRLYARAGAVSPAHSACSSQCDRVTIGGTQKF
jgi:hypothetical protein